MASGTSPRIGRDSTRVKPNRASSLVAFCLILLAQLPIACAARDCQPVVPSALPSGAQPGLATEGVSGGAKQVTWGQGRDRVDLRIGLSYYAEGADALLAEPRVRGEPAIVYRIVDDSSVAFTWTSQGCTYTVFPAPDLTVDEIAAYAGRY